MVGGNGRASAADRAMLGLATRGAVAFSNTTSNPSREGFYSSMRVISAAPVSPKSSLPLTSRFELSLFDNSWYRQKRSVKHPQICGRLEWN